MQDITLEVLKEAKQLCLSYKDRCTSLKKQLTCPYYTEEHKIGDFCKLMILQRELVQFQKYPMRWTDDEISIILKKYLIHLIEK